MLPFCFSSINFDLAAPMRAGHVVMWSHMPHQSDISCLLIAGMKNSRARAAHEGRVNSTGKR